MQPAEGHLLLENIAVTPSAQNMGLGSRLLRLAERHALAMGLPEIRLYTNEAMTGNLGYYPRRGYQETHFQCRATAARRRPGGRWFRAWRWGSPPVGVAAPGALYPGARAGGGRGSAFGGGVT
jgi:GNAT superfamily N-acetyltransferase